MAHQFDVQVSDHDSLKLGVVAKRLHGSQHTHHRVVVSGSYTFEEAHLIAAQMAAAHGMPTAVLPRI